MKLEQLLILILKILIIILLIQYVIYFKKNKNIFDKEENMKNEIKEIILNNTKVIKESIEDKLKKNYSIKQKDNEKILLKFANILYKPKNTNFLIIKMKKI